MSGRVGGFGRGGGVVGVHMKFKCSIRGLMRGHSL